MKKTLQASLSAVLVLSLVGCKSTAAPVSSTQSAQNNTFYQDAIDAYVNEINMDYAYDFTKTLSLVHHYMTIHLVLEQVVLMQNIELQIILQKRWKKLV